MRSSILLPLAFVAVSAQNATTTTAASMPTVTLDYSTIVAAAGNTIAESHKYQNIRFAAVPTGNLRWAAPEWPPAETYINTGTLADEDVDCASSEDRLYMDIWAPANSGNKSLPVMVYPNTLWSEDKINWPMYGNSSTAGTQIVFNTSFYLEEDDLATNKSLYWNQVLWY